MQVKTSINLNFHLREEVKLIQAVYGAQNLSALVNGFFYYLCHGENPKNGVDIERCMQDALAGNIQITKNPQLLAEARKEAAAFSCFEEFWGGDPYLVYLRRFGIRSILRDNSRIHKLCEDTYSHSGVVILEDDMRRYLTAWYEGAKGTPRFDAVELEVLKSGGIVPQMKVANDDENSED